MSIVLGIDLGTTNSSMSYVVGGKPVIIENSEGARTTPSVFFWNKKDDSVTIGVAARNKLVLSPADTLYEVKRFIGKSYSDAGVKEDVDAVGYKVEDENGKIRIKTSNDKAYAPEQISAAVLRKLKTDAEAKLGQSITEAVITVPAYFNDAQRQATKDAGEIAGLKVLRIINEPTAAALAYGFEKGQDEKVLVYDLGGGTFDVTVLDIAPDTIEVLATNGDTHLGGADFDRVIMAHIVSEFKKETGVNLDKDKAAKQRIKDAAEKAKHDLSSQSQHEVSLPFITMVDGQPQNLSVTITRTKLEDLVRPLVERTMVPVKQALSDSGLSKDEIKEIIMVGGMTRMPLVQKIVEEYFGKKPNLTVNPDEVVAMGAAIQGAVLKGEVKDILLLDVTPLTLAIETAGNIATAMIGRNTTVPTTKSQVFSTYADNQTSVDVHVVQGERPMAYDNKSLGKFTLSGIAPAPRNVPQIEVSFDLDANGILTVKAKDKGTGKEANITIAGSSNMTDLEKEQAVKEAETQKDADLAKKARVTAKNDAEATIIQADKLVKDMGDKLETLDKEAILKLKEELETLVKEDGFEKEIVEAKNKELTDKMMEIGTKIYSNSSAETPTENGETPVQEVKE